MSIGVPRILTYRALEGHRGVRHPSESHQGNPAAYVRLAVARLETERSLEARQGLLMAVECAQRVTEVQMRRGIVR